MPSAPKPARSPATAICAGSKGRRSFERDVDGGERRPLAPSSCSKRPDPHHARGHLCPLSILWMFVVFLQSSLDDTVLRHIGAAWVLQSDGGLQVKMYSVVFYWCTVISRCNNLQL